MVEVVSGEGLGLFDSHKANNNSGNIGQGLKRVSVNANTGNLVLQQRDKVLFGQGQDSAIVRTYNSQGLFNDDNGDNFRFSFNQQLHRLTGTINTVGSSLIRINGDGHEALFHYDDTQAVYISHDGSGAHDSLSYDSEHNTWTYIEGSSQVHETYSWDGSVGQLLSQVDHEGLGLVSVLYGSNGLVEQLFDSSGQTISLRYVGNNVASVTTSTADGQGGQSVVNTLTYAYDAQDRLVLVNLDLTPSDSTDAKVYQTTYAYVDDNSALIKSIRQSDGSVVSIDYETTGDRRVTQVSVGEGSDAQVTQYHYDATSTQIKQQTGVDAFTTTTVHYDTQANITHIDLPLDGQGQASSHHYQYDTEHNLTQFTDALGNTTRYDYDANGNVVQEQDALGNTVSRVYSQDNLLLNEVAYRIPDGDLGNGLNDAGDPLVTRYVYDEQQRLRFVVAADGSVSEWQYSDSGAAANATRKLSQRTYLVARYTAEPVGNALLKETPIALSEMISWVDGIIDKSHTQLSETLLDFRHQISQVTEYSKVNTDGTGDMSSATHQHYLYDQYGQLLKTVDARGADIADEQFVSHFAYDGLGRLISATDAEGYVSTTHYLDAQSRVSTRLANGLYETLIYSSAGNITSTHQSAAEHIVLNDQGQIHYSIDSAGHVTEYSYNHANEVIALKKYDQRINADGVVTEHDVELALRAVFSQDFNQPVFNGLDHNLDKHSNMGIDPSSGKVILRNNYSEKNARSGLWVDATEYQTGHGYRLEFSTDHNEARKFRVRLLSQGVKKNAPEYRMVQLVLNGDTVNVQTKVGEAKTETVATYNGVIDSNAQYVMEMALTATNEQVIYLFKKGQDRNHADAIQVTTHVDGWEHSNKIRFHQYTVSNRSFNPDDAPTIQLDNFLQYDTNKQATYKTPAGHFEPGQADATDIVSLMQLIDPLIGVQQTQSLQLVRNAEGQIRFAIDTHGMVTAFAYSADGGLMDVRQYEQALSLTADQIAALELENMHDLEMALMAHTSEDFSQLSVDGFNHNLDQYADSGFDLVAGDVVLTNAYSDNKAWPGLWTEPVDYPVGQGYRLEFTTDNSNDRWFRICLETDSPSSNDPHFRMAQIAINGDRFYLQSKTGEVATQTHLNIPGAILDNTTYVLELELTAADQQTFYMFKKGENRDSPGAIEYSTQVSGWDLNGNVRLRPFVQNNNSFDPDAQPVTRLDNFIQYNVQQTSGYQFWSAQTASSEQYVYDSKGLLRAVVDARGATTQTIYDAKDQRVGEIDAQGYLTETFYDAHGQVTSALQYAKPVPAEQLALLHQQAATGEFAVPASHDALALVRPESHPEDRQAHSIYDASNRLQYTLDAKNYVVEYQYDGTGQLINSIAYANAATITNPGTQPLTAAQLTISVDTSQDRQEQFIYDAVGNLQESMDGEGYRTTYTYNPSGQLIHSTWHGLEESEAIHHYALFNSKGQLVTEVDGEGYRTDYFYDAAANINRITRYAQRLTTDSLHHLAANPGAVRPEQLLFDDTLVEIGQDQTTTYRYNALNQLIQETDPSGATTAYSYNAFGQVKAIVYGKGELIEGHRERHQQLIYDAKGQLVREVTGEQAQGIINGAIPANAGTQHQYDTAGRRIQSTDALGNSRYFYYNDRNQLRYSLDALGHVIAYQYNAFGELTSEVYYHIPLDLSVVNVDSGLLSTSDIEQHIVSAPTDDEREYAYTTRGLLATERDNGSSVSPSKLIEYQYNAFGDATAVSNWNGQSIASNARETSFSYDRRGLLTTERLGTQASSKRIVQRYTYDSFGRLTTQTDGKNNVDTYNYDKNSRLTSTLRNGRLQSSSEYDAFDRQLKETNALGQSIQYQYSDAQRQLTLRSAEGIVTVFITNAFGETLSITDLSDPQAPKELGHYQYNSDGQITQLRDGAGGEQQYNYDELGRLSIHSDNGLVMQYSYDAIGRTLSIVTDPAGENLQQRFSYADSGRRLIEENNGQQIDRYFDAKGQLEKEIIDPNGEALLSRYEYNLDGQLTIIREGSAQHGAEIILRSTAYFYDNATGLLIEERQDAEGSARSTHFAQDNAGNVFATTDALGQSSYVYYDDKHQPIYHLDRKGFLSESVYDEAGQLIAQRVYTQSLSAEQHQDYSDQTTLKIEIDAFLAGNPEHVSEQWFYDADSRLLAAIDRDGVIAKYQYDSASNMTQTTLYAAASAEDSAQYTPFNSTESLLAYLATQTAHTQTHSIYDDLGREVYHRDGEGYVSEWRYDLRGNIIRETRYSEPVDSAQFQALGADDVIENNTAITTQFYYDAVDRHIATIDAKGSVSVSQYDALGHIIEQQQYLDLIFSDANNRVIDRGELNDFLLQQADAYTRQQFIYDEANRLRYSIDALGTVTQYDYDALGSVTTMTQFEDSFVKNSGDILVDLASKGMGQTAEEMTQSVPEFLNDVTLLLSASSGFNRQDWDDQLIQVVSSSLLERWHDDVKPLIEDAAKQEAEALIVALNTHLQGADRRILELALLCSEQPVMQLGIMARELDSGVDGSRVLGEMTLLVDDPEHFYTGQAVLERLSDEDLESYIRRLYEQAAADVIAGFETITQNDNTFSATIAAENVLNPDNIRQDHSFQSFSLFIQIYGLNPDDIVVNLDEQTQTYHFSVIGTGSAPKAMDFGFQWSLVPQTISPEKFSDVGGTLDAQLKAFCDQQQLAEAFNRSMIVVDNQQQPVYEINEQGFVIGYAYDALGRVTQKSHYEVSLMPALEQGDLDIEAFPFGQSRTAIEAFFSPYLQHAAADTAQSFYNEKGQQTATIDALGFVTSYQYDAFGNMTLQAQYSSSIFVDTQYREISASELKAYIESETANAVRSHDFYNAKNQITASIDALGYVVLNTYDEQGNVIAIRQYKASILNHIGSQEVNESQLEAFLLDDTLEYTVSGFIYDNNNRLRFSIDHLGYVKEFHYDALGNIIETIAYEGNFTEVPGNILADLASQDMGQTAEELTQSVPEFLNHVTLSLSASEDFNRQDWDDELMNITSQSLLERWGGAKTLIKNAAQQEAEALIVALNTHLQEADRRILELALLSSDQPVMQLGVMARELDSEADGVRVIGDITLLVDDPEYLYTGQTMLERFSGEDLESYIRRLYEQAATDLIAGFETITQNDSTFSATIAADKVLDKDNIHEDASYRFFSFFIQLYDLNPADIVVNLDEQTQTYHYSAISTDSVPKAMDFGFQWSLVPQTISTEKFSQQVDSLDAQYSQTVDADFLLALGLGGSVETFIEELPASETAFDAYLQRLSEEKTSNYFVYDNNTLRFEIDAEGYVTEFAYDTQGNIIERHRYASSIQSFVDTADAVLNVEQIKAQLAGSVVQTSYAVYDQSSQQRFDIDALGYVHEYHYDYKGNVIESTRHGLSVSGRLTDIALDVPSIEALLYENGQAVNATQTEHTLYDDLNRVRYHIDAEGYVQQLHYDHRGNIAKQIRYIYSVDAFTGSFTDSAAFEEYLSRLHQSVTSQQTTHFVYDANNQQQFVVDARGFVSAFEYDQSGRIIQQTQYTQAASFSPGLDNLSAESVNAFLDGGAGGSDLITTRYQYDELGRLRYEIDAENHVQEYRYNAYGQMIQNIRYNGDQGLAGANTVDTSDAVVTRIFDDQGNVRFDIDAENYVTESIYNVRGDVIQFVRYRQALNDDALTLVDDIDVEQMSAAVLAVNPLDEQRANTYYLYDGLGQLRYDISAEGTVTEYRYNETGQMVETIHYEQTLTLDGIIHDDQTTLLARITTLAEASQTTQYQYDAQQQMIRSIDALNNIVDYEYDASGNLIREVAYQEPLGQTQQFDNARVNHFVYDSNNQRRFDIDAEGYVTEYQYNHRGQVTASIKWYEAIAVDSLLTSHVISEAEILHLLQVPTMFDASYDQTQLTQYDAVGNTISHIDAAGKEETFQYDYAGNLSLKTDKNGEHWRYSYDKNSRKIADYSPEMSVSEVDEAGTLNSAAETRFVKTSYGYDALDNLISKTEDDGGSNARILRYDYDKNGRLITTHFPESEQHFFGTGSRTTVNNTINKRSWYDAAGNIIKTKNVEGQYSHSLYDKDNRLRYHVDAAGFISEYQYDALNNTVSFTRYASDGLYRQMYFSDRSQSPTQAEIETFLASHQTTDDRTVSYRYDDLNRRIQIIEPRVMNVREAENAEYALRFEQNNGLSITIETDLFDHADHVDLYYREGTNTDSPLQKITALQTANGWQAVTEDRLATGDYLFYFESTQANGELIETRRTTSGRFSVINQPEHIVQTGTNACGANLSEQIPSKYQIIQETKSLSLDGAEQNLVELYQASPITALHYNAFGELTKKAVALDESSWRESQDFYNARGLRIAQVDEQGYVTTWVYDANGNVTEHTEYAVAVSGERETLSQLQTWLAQNAHRDDRTTQYNYDNKNRLIKQTQLAVDYAGDDYQTESLNLSASLVTDYEYDNNDRLIKITDALGNFTRHEYDAVGRLVKTIEPSRDVYQTVNNIVVIGQDACGANISEMQPTRELLGQFTPEIHYAYDSLGNQVAVRRVVGDESQEQTFRFNALGHKIAEFNAEGDQYQFSYDALGQLREQWFIRRVSLGEDVESSTRYFYDANGHMTEVAKSYRGETGDAVAREHLRYNAFGDLVAKGKNGDDWEYFDYDQAGRLIKSNTGDGIDRLYGYNLAGQQVLSLQSDRETSLQGDIDTEQAFNDAIAQDSLSLSALKYDGLGRVVQMQGVGFVDYHGDRVKPITDYSYDRWGNVIEQVDARGNKTVYSYNDYNQVTSVQYAHINMMDHLGVESKNNQLQSTAYYDLLGRKIHEVDERGNVTSYTRNSLGQITEKENALGEMTEYGYDYFGQQILERFASGRGVEKKYNALGQIIETRRGNTVETFEYDQAGQLITSSNNAGNVNRYFYDDSGNTIETRMGDDVNYAKEFYYDAYGNLVKEVDEMDREKHWFYQSAEHAYHGLVDTYINLGGQTTVYEYDALNRKTSEKIDQGAQYWRSDYRYQNDGRLKAIFSGVDEVAADENSWWLSTNKNVTNYGYDVMGNRVLESYSQSGVILKNTRLGFDARNRLFSISENSEIGHFDTLYDFDAVGNRILARNHNRLAASELIVGEWSQFDALNRVTSSHFARESDGSVGDLAHGYGGTYTYDLEGNRKTATFVADDGIGDAEFIKETYDYNAAGQVLKTTQQRGDLSFDEGVAYIDFGTDKFHDFRAYDLAGRIKEVASKKNDEEITEEDKTKYYYDIYGRLIGKGDYGFNYDRAGNMLTMINGDETTNYTYRYIDQAKIDTITTIKGSETKAVRHIYDAMGNLIRIDSDYNAQDNHYLVDQSGKILKRTEGAATWYHHFANGNKVGESYIRDASSSSSKTFRASESTSGEWNWDDGQTRIYNKLEAMANEISLYLRSNFDSQQLAAYDDYYKQAGKVSFQLEGTERDNFSREDDHFNETFTVDYQSGDLASYMTAVLTSAVYEKMRHLFFEEESLDRGQPDVGSFRVTFVLADLNLATYNDYDFATAHNHGSMMDLTGSVSSHSVQAGDTLQGMALSYYGDSSLWYLIADANGLSATDVLSVGRKLTIPSVISHRNDADTFRPYKAGEAQGSVLPHFIDLPEPQPIEKANRDNLKQILTLVAVIMVAIIVTIAVSVATAGLGTALMGSAWATTASVVGGAIGGFTGSLAAQGVMIGIAGEGEINWAQTGVDALIGAVSFGVGSYVAQAAKGTSMLTKARYIGAETVLDMGLGIAAEGVMAAIDKDREFDWKTVAITSAVAGGAMVGGTVMARRMSGAGNKYVMTVDDDRISNMAAQRLVDKKGYRRIDAEALSKVGPKDKLSFVGHGDKGAGTIGGKNIEGLSDLLSKNKFTGAKKISLVACNSDNIAGKLFDKLNHSSMAVGAISGRGGAVSVLPNGRKLVEGVDHIHYKGDKTTYSGKSVEHRAGGAVFKGDVSGLEWLGKSKRVKNKDRPNPIGSKLKGAATAIKKAFSNAGTRGKLKITYKINGEVKLEVIDLKSGKLTKQQNELYKGRDGMVVKDIGMKKNGVMEIKKNPHVEDKASAHIKSFLENNKNIEAIKVSLTMNNSPCNGCTQTLINIKDQLDGVVDSNILRVKFYVPYAMKLKEGRLASSPEYKSKIENIQTLKNRDIYLTLQRDSNLRKKFGPDGIKSTSSKAWKFTDNIQKRHEREEKAYSADDMFSNKRIAAKEQFELEYGWGALNDQLGDDSPYKKTLTALSNESSGPSGQATNTSNLAVD